jgi:2-polyprenyl-3-methyl-5-hydroxy-6-metoxy-1,4-benzoquinol methylase
VEAGRWNHNVHYHPVILRAVPPGAERALDVGCGEGVMTRALRAHAGHVIGIDRDAPSLRLARRHPGGAGVEYVLGDLRASPFVPGSFDFVSCVAALHHLDDEDGLRHLRALLCPGGGLGIVGIARSHVPIDLPTDVAGAVASRLHRRTKTPWETPAPTCWPPRRTFREIRRLVARVLPGARYRRHVLWRYTVTWTKPRA